MTQGLVTAINPEAMDAARAAIPSQDALSLLVETFDALADPARAHILHALGPGELCVRDLALAVGSYETAVSHRLRLLRNRRLVKPRRDGTIIYYTVDDQHLAALFREAGYHVDHVRRAHPHGTGLPDLGPDGAQARARARAWACGRPRP
jgi:DNA-binding transcriptional ArsR family regulator